VQFKAAKCGRRARAARPLCPAVRALPLCRGPCGGPRPYRAHRGPQRRQRGWHACPAAVGPLERPRRGAGAGASRARAGAWPPGLRRAKEVEGATPRGRVLTWRRLRTAGGDQEGRGFPQSGRGSEKGGTTRGVRRGSPPHASGGSAQGAGSRTSKGSISKTGRGGGSGGCSRGGRGWWGGAAGRRQRPSERVKGRGGRRLRGRGCQGGQPGL
jgi:hypothetical protein